MEPSAMLILGIALGMFLMEQLVGVYLLLQMFKMIERYMEEMGE